jgi:ferredoxin
MFGTVLLANKPKTHAQAASLDRFTSALVDIYSVSNPQLTIVDGYYGMEGQGPSSGEPVKLDLILAGYDGVALDRTVCEIVGFNASEILYLEKAEQVGLGTGDLAKIEFVGEEIKDVERKFKPPKIRPVSMPLPRWLADYVGQTIFKARVKFNREKCKICSTCWTNCPVKAIAPPNRIKKGQVPIWDKNKCITCFCCVELCPYEAVDFKINYVRNFLFSWLGVGLIGLMSMIALFLIWLILL